MNRNDLTEGFGLITAFVGCAALVVGVWTLSQAAGLVTLGVLMLLLGMLLVVAANRGAE